MNNYIVCTDKLQNEFRIGSQNGINKHYTEINEKKQSSNAIIWNTFAPWKYSDKHTNDPRFIFKIIEKACGKQLKDTDFRNNEYNFFGHKPMYFKYSQPDLVIDNEKNCLFLEAKYTEDSGKAENDKCEQIISYLCDIFHKFSSIQEYNPYFIVLYPKETGHYYEYYQIIETCKNNSDQIRLKIQDCLERRKNKEDVHYDRLISECEALQPHECEHRLKKICENIGMISWDELRKLLFECIDNDQSDEFYIDDWSRYVSFFNERASIDFLLQCYAQQRSNLEVKQLLNPNLIR